MKNPRIVLIVAFFLSVGYSTIAQNSTVTDIQGRVYKTIRIGRQVWMAENLATTELNDGSSIPIVENDLRWANSKTMACCYFFNDPVSYKDRYGLLYNYYTIATGKVCPTGWHVPSDEEWEQMINFIGGGQTAGFKLKKQGHDYWDKKYGGINSYRFSALPGGWRTDNKQYSFSWLCYEWKVARWWSSTENFLIPNFVFIRSMDNTSDAVRRYDIGKTSGCSVRCVKNNP